MKKNVKAILSVFTICLVFGSKAAFACDDVSGVYRCNPADAPEVYTTTEFVHTPDLLSIIDISSDGTKRLTDEFKLDGKRHLGPFGTIYSSQCNTNKPLKIAMRNVFIKAVAEYKVTNDGLTILRNGKVIQTCTK